MAKTVRYISGGMPINAAQTFYNPLAGSAGNNTAETTGVQIPCRPGGTFTNLLSHVITNTLSVTATVRLRKNAANANNTVSITTGATGDFEDTTSSDTFAAGDTVSLQQISPAGSGTITYRVHSLIFDASTDSRTQLSENGNQSLATANTTRYATLTGNRDATTMAITTETQAQTLFRTAFTLRNLECHVVTNARTTTTTIRTRRAAANGLQSLSITSTATGRFEDTTNSDAFLAISNLVDYSVTTGTGTQTITFYNIACGVDSTTNTTYLMGSTASGVTQTFNITTYSAFGTFTIATTEADYPFRARLAGTLKNLTLNLQANTVNGASTFRLRKNGANAAVSISIGASTAGTFSDITNTETVVATDLINLQMVTGGTSGSMTLRTQNAELVADVQVTQTKTHKYNIEVKLATQVIRFQKSTGANGTTQDVTLNFTPKAIIVYSDGNTADNTVSAHYQVCLGFSDGTNHAATYGGSEDAAAVSDTGRIHRNDSVFVRNSEATPATTVCRGSCAFGTNKVTFTWTVNDAVATYIHLIAFGGDNITAAKVNSVDYGINTVGTQDYTGLGFTPTTGNAALFTMESSLSGLNTSGTHAAPTLGCAVSTTKRWLLSNLSQHAADPSATWRLVDTNHVLMTWTGTGGLNSSADFDGWITDGFRLDHDAPPSVTTVKFSYLVINGGTWDAGTLTTPTAVTNNVDTAVSVSSNTLRGLMLASTGAIANASIGAPGQISIGATDGTTQSVISCRDNNAAATVISNRVNSTASIFRLYSVTETILDDGVFDSFTTNNFRLDYPTTKSTNAELINWVVVADPLPLTVVSQTKTHKYNVEAKVAVYQGTFNKLSGNGTQTITGLPFQPKAVIFWNATMPGTTIVDGWSSSYGFSDGTNNMVVGTYASDNTANSTSGSALNNALSIFTWESTGTTAGVANVTGFTSDGFTLSWASSTATTYLIHYMAIGGTDITDVKVGQQTVGTTTSGNKSYTPTTFQPDFLLTVNEGWISTSAYADGQNNATLGIGVSAMKSSSERWSMMNVIEGGRAASESWRYKREDKCFSLLDSSTGSVHGEADFVSFDSTGWTWNYSTAGVNITNSKYIYLAIKGGVWDVGSGPIGVTGTTSRTVNTNSNAKLRGVGFAFGGLVTGNNIPNATAIYSIGGTDGTRQSCIAGSDLNAALTMANVKIQKTDAVVYGTVANATAGSSTIFSVGSLSSFGTSDFTTTWTNIDANAYIYHYFALSQSTAVGGQNYPVSINESTVSVSEAVARILSAVRAPSESAVSVSETLTRIQSLIKTINETSITVNQTLARVQTLTRTIPETAVTGNESLARSLVQIKTISEPSVTGNESLARILAATRAIADPSLSTNDTIARLIAVSYTLTEPSISVNQTLVGILTFLRPISETAITTNDTIAKTLAATRTVADPSISINDTLARIQTILRQISESSITVDDSLTASLLFVISMVESRIKWYYSLLTRKIEA